MRKHPLFKILFSIAIIMTFSPLLTAQTCSEAELNSKKDENCSSSQKQKIAVFDTPAGHSHSTQVLKVIQEQIKKCNICEAELFPIYNDQGNLLLTQFIEGLKKIDSKYKVVNLSWNLPYEEKYFSVVQELNRIAKAGVVIVAAGGVETGKVPPVDISQTVVGRVDKIIIVGELIGKKLSTQAYYGSKISIALEEDKKRRGSSYSAAKVSGALLKATTSGAAKDWPAHFAQIKKESNKVWPSLSEYF